MENKIAKIKELKMKYYTESKVLNNVGNYKLSDDAFAKYIAIDEVLIILETK